MDLRENDTMRSELLYRGIADRLKLQIDQGVLRPGDRMPSLRSLQHREQCSLSTVLEAYHLLEQDGWIEARPQSGHFVLARSSPTVRLVSEVSIDGRISQILKDLGDPRMISFGAAVPSDSFLPLAQISRSLARQNRAEDSHRYEDPRGNPALRRFLAVLHSSRKRVYDEDDVVITNGCSEALFVSLMTLAQRNSDTVLVESPAYFGIYQIIELLGLRAIEIHSSPSTGVSPEDFARAVQMHRPRAAILIPNFSNPTGALMPANAKRDIAAIARAEGVAIVEDDIYGDIFYEGDERPPALLAGGEASGVLCGSVSKIISPGLRIGWAISKEFGGRIGATKRILNLSTNRLAQAATLDFMRRRSYEIHLKRLRTTLAGLSARYRQELVKAFPHAEISRPSGGYAIWVKTERDTQELSALSREHSISIAPGFLFDASGEHRRCFRMNCGLEWTPRTRKAVETLGRLYREMDP